MASIRSLGLHQPSGLQYAINEQILPQNPPTDSYKWSILPDDTGNGLFEDELLVTKDAVVWSRGGIIQKSYRFHLEKEPIVHALFTYFPASEDEKKDSLDMKNEDQRKNPGLEKALVVFLKTQAHIYFLSGTNHIVHMPFEVESACAAPVGVIIQRNQRPESAASMSLKMPRVPPNSFVSSQLTVFTSSQQSTFSIENLGNPKPLKLGLGSTLGQVWEANTKPVDTHWPRLVSLTDPLLDIGLVVTNTGAEPAKRGKKAPPKKPVFLDPSHEVLHIENISLPGAEPLVLAVTINREASIYTVWRLNYLEHKDPFVRQQKKSRRRSTLRRSSIQPGLAGGATTPLNATFRESFGAQAPLQAPPPASVVRKRTRKADKGNKPLDLVSSIEQQDKESKDVTRRSSRRVSSMLARADLSASHERSAFLEQPSVTAHATSRKHDSIGSHAGRLSSSHNHQSHLSLGSLLEAPFDMGLDEGLNNMGLDDHGLDGLQHEIMLSEIHSVDMESNSFHYSTAESASKSKPRVFVLTAPPFASNERSRSQLLVGIQDAEDKRLQLMVLHLRFQQPKRTRGVSATGPATVSITPGELRVAQNVVDSTKLVDGDQSVVLVLSESMDGRHELSIQAPWRELTKISVSTLFAESTRSLFYAGRSIHRDVKNRKSEVVDFSNGSIVGVRHPRARGVVDVLDTEGRLHQLRIQLQPSSPQVAKVLDVCASILPDSVGERVHAGWFHVMQWLESCPDTLANFEWSAVTILLLSIFLNLGRKDATQTFRVTRSSPRKRRPASGTFGSIRDSDDWKALEAGETVNSLGCPPWMMNRGWDWALDEDADDSLSPHTGQSTSPKFISRHITLAKEFLSSPVGDAAVGHGGFLPTALSKTPEARRKSAVDIFMALHLLLEEEKLDIMTPEYNSPGRTDLRVVLCQIGRWLGWQEFWTIYELGIQEDIDQRHDTEVQIIPPISQPPVRPDILHWVQSRLITDDREPYPTPRDVFYSSARLAEADTKWDQRWDDIVPRTLTFKRFFKALKRGATAVEMVEAMQQCGMTPHFLETLPEAVLVPLQDAIALCQPRPPSSWSSELLELVKRTDISLVLTPGKRPRTGMASILTPTHVASRDYKLLCQTVEESNSIGYDEGDGTERQAVIRALFKEDRRLNEVQTLLSTHKARVVSFQPEPEWTESVYLEKQKEFVSRIATGTLAIPSGRAMLYYSLRYPLITQEFHIGGFNLNCIVKPANVTVGVDKSHFTEEKVCWGFFHQGVAAGLAISPQAKGIDSSWILYNKPGGQDLSNRHAGFLLALGLNGHLKGVAKWVAFKYLTPKHTMTSIGLLLGLAASYLGTMDSLITRLLSVHATRMLPRGAAELNLSPLTQTCGIMGIGLLYCNSQHRRMSEIMLSEIEHIDEGDEEEPLRSECYRLAAGFSLGLINLGKGSDLKGLYDLRLTEKLIMHATATKNVEIVHILDRAAAGAVMAIALIFMKSEDAIVARKIDVPASVLQFDYVRPDILLLRTVAKNIIMWSKIQPTFAWVEESLPDEYRARHGLQSTTKLQSTDLPFFSILAGICLSIALRFSGSAALKVRDLLLHYLDHFIRITRIPSSQKDNPDAPPPYDEELARENARMCQDVLALSASIVMAGSGDIPVLRRLRSLHGRDDPDTPYGSHLAGHLAIGALFLGCGTATFGSSNLAIASLLISFYPIFPNDVMDNRSHLQAFRHFWVLATEQRCLVAKDILTGQPISVSVIIQLKNSQPSPTVRRTTPCLLPPLDQISRLTTDCGSQFWDIEVDFDKDGMREAFTKTQSIYLRRRPPREGAFTSTLGALGRDGRDDTPLEWLFGLDSLREVTHAERAAMMQNSTASDEQESGGRALDARMEIERGIEYGGDRERLESARVLFEWGAARDELLRPGAAAADIYDSMATEKADGDEDGAHDIQGTWWMRDSVIEGLKGKVMLVGRDAEQG
ncbi:anaphase-promoting complex subunit 1 [Geosmithia morbida]|uniref:Anaphase-promoting complex subunit 1 n=1 Tax=Geosmithia morbida TaxID=1094350 RepID=A0A9P5D7X2_9HYPO|nr:anaphase-promoting complex subunit 1 [Geosmithia morbida]KAF4126185.1 anaphase-promoting complex subunit 1 [Geosmithia morbida]